MEELKKYREFTVTPGICGFKVSIGCTEAYFGDVNRLADAIGKYLLDPTGAEAEFREGDLRQKGEEGPQPTGPAPAGSGRQAPDYRPA